MDLSHPKVGGSVARLSAIDPLRASHMAIVRGSVLRPPIPPQLHELEFAVTQQLRAGGEATVRQ
jgi:hypothetical protein